MDLRREDEEEVSDEISRDDLAIWNEMTESHNRFIKARRAFFTGNINRVALIRRALPTKDRFLAFNSAQYLSPAEHMQLFEEWVRYSTLTDYFSAAHKYLLSLPKEWVMERIEQAVEPYLLKGDEIDYSRYLDLYSNLDHDLAIKLAQRAIAHLDEGVREVGKEYLSLLEEDQAHKNG